MKLLLAWLLSPALLSPGSGAAPAGQASGEAPAFICPPCGADCHFTTYPREGNCGGCGMKLVPLASVPQVGVLLMPSSDLVASMLTLSVFASSNAVRAFTVSDTTEPMRLGDTLEVRPQFAFAEAPRLDVLVVPECFGAWDDALVVEWAKGAVEKARCVVAVSAGSVLVARTGALAGERVPGPRFLVERGKELAPGLVFDAELDYRRAGKFFLARDAGAAIRASLGALAELAGEERARRTASELGIPWEPEEK